APTPPPTQTRQKVRHKGWNGGVGARLQSIAPIPRFAVLVCDGDDDDVLVFDAVDDHVRETVCATPEKSAGYLSAQFRLAHDSLNLISHFNCKLIAEA